MANPFLAQILQAALQSRAGGGGFGGALAGGLGGGLGGPLGGLFGRGSPAAGGGKRTVLLALMLPLVMRWIQRNGGIGAVLQRFRQQGLGRQADSWVSTGANHAISPQDVRSVVGSGELATLASSLGVSEDEAAQAFSEALPEVADQVTPEGNVTPQADQRLARGSDALEEAFGELHAHMQQMPG